MKPILAPLLLLIAGLLATGPAASAEIAEDADFDSFEFEALEFDDSPLAEPLTYPDWFKKSFLFLPDDLEEALEDTRSVQGT